MIKIAFHPIYAHPLPEGHRFPMLKYELIPKQLLYEGTVTEANFFEPKAVNHDDVLAIHSQSYFDDLLRLTLSEKAIRKIGFPLSNKLVERELIITQGTIDCCAFATDNGVAFNVAGGTHHAFADSGEGFCLLNDVAVAAQKLLSEKKVKQILVVDLDVHQGNGTAKIFENNPNVFTFSMHGKDNYPMHKTMSDLDVELPTGCQDEQYLELLKQHLPILIANVKPNFMFYVSGVDVLATDKLGKLKLSKEGCLERDRFVFNEAKKGGIPVVVVMGGGYSPKIIDILEAHCNTFRAANELYFSSM
jgi:acetoin utilization deacetylase AcuC-like enzyme